MSFFDLFLTWPHYRITLSSNIECPREFLLVISLIFSFCSFIKWLYLNISQWNHLIPDFFLTYFFILQPLLLLKFIVFETWSFIWIFKPGFTHNFVTKWSIPFFQWWHFFCGFLSFNDDISLCIKNLSISYAHFFLLLYLQANSTR